MDERKSFDRGLILQRRKRALANQPDGIDFLLARAAGDLEERLGTIGRRFPIAVDLCSHNQLAAQALRRSGKAELIIRIEQDAAFLANGFPSIVADDEAVPLKGASIDLLVSLLSLHLTNDTPGTLVQIRQALKPDGLFLGAMAGDNTLIELRESLLAAESELTGGASPRVIFTDPQVGAVGLTLAAAQEAGLPVRAVDVETSGNAGGSFVGRGAPGTARIVVDEERRVVVGATITGAEVAEALHAATIAVVAEVSLDDLWHAVPSFPTRSEIWLRLLEAYGM